MLTFKFNCCLFRIFNVLKEYLRSLKPSFQCPTDFQTGSECLLKAHLWWSILLIKSLKHCSNMLYQSWHVRTHFIRQHPKNEAETDKIHKSSQSKEQTFLHLIKLTNPVAVHVKLRHVINRTGWHFVRHLFEMRKLKPILESQIG